LAVYFTLSYHGIESALGEDWQLLIIVANASAPIASQRVEASSGKVTARRLALVTQMRPAEEHTSKLTNKPSRESWELIKLPQY
jgi:hypothetical protein